MRHTGAIDEKQVLVSANSDANKLDERANALVIKDAELRAEESELRRLTKELGNKTKLAIYQVGLCFFIFSFGTVAWYCKIQVHQDRPTSSPGGRCHTCLEVPKDRRERNWGGPCAGRPVEYFDSRAYRSTMETGSGSSPRMRDGAISDARVLHSRKLRERAEGGETWPETGTSSPPSSRTVKVPRRHAKGIGLPARAMPCR